LLFTAACSQKAEDLTDAELRDAIVETLTEDDTLTAAVASCVVDGLFDQAPRAQINHMANAETADELDEEDMALLIDLLIGCS
jgi:hypothetical protein